MTSRYPAEIDGYQQIRVARDGVDEIVATDHNALRSAVVKVEQTLGINPAGSFGTVVARLESASADIMSHVTGSQPKHQDTVIEGAAKSSSYLALAAGSTATQLSALVQALGESSGALRVGYAGSGADKFADGSAVPSGTVKSGLGSIASMLGGSSGSERIGASGFSTGKFSVSGADIDAQLKSLGGVADELSEIAEMAFAGLVTSGLAVTRANATSVNVSSGFLMSDGLLRRYAGGTFAHSGAGFHRIYAYINSSGNIAIGDAASDAALMANVPLAVFTETGAAHTGFVGLRRFGLHMNREQITVGSDGYGADFTSFKSAMEYMSRAVSAGAFTPRKIMVVSDITVPSAELPIELESDMMVDGGNHTLTWSADSALFKIDNKNRVVVKNVRGYYSPAAVGVNAAFLDIDATTSASEVEVSTCFTRSGGGLGYFITYDTSGGGSLDTLVVESCNARCELSALKGGTAAAEAAPKHSRIAGNYFGQNSFVAQADPCMMIGDFSIADGNVLQGGYNVGIRSHYAEGVVVSDNIVNGGTGTRTVSGTAYMAKGIEMMVNASLWLQRSIISGNYVKGCTSVGVDLNPSGTGEATNCMVSGNMVDNSRDFDAASIGVRGDDQNSMVEGNYIIHPGTYAVYKSPYIVGNMVHCKQGNTMTSAIDVSGTDPMVVSGNMVFDLSGDGITGSGDDFQLVHGNYISFDSGGAPGVGVSGMGENAAIAYNYIGSPGTYGINHGGDSGTVAGNVIDSATGIGINISGLLASVYGNAIVDCQGASCVVVSGNRASVADNLLVSPTAKGVALSSAQYCMVSGNYVSGAGGTAIEAGSGCHHASFVGNYAYSGSGIGILASAERCLASSNFAYGGTVGISFDASAARGAIVANHVVDNTGAAAIENYSGLCLISGNFSRNAGGVGIRLDGNAIDVIGNFVDEPTSHAFEAPGSHAWSSVVGNYVRLSGDHAIEMESSYEALIIGNNLNGVTGIGISTNGVLCTVASNKIRSASSHGIDINDGDSNLVIGNHLYSIGEYGINGDSSDLASIIGNFISTVTNANQNGIGIAGDRCSIVGNFIQNISNIGINATGDNNLVSSNVIDTADFCIRNGANALIIGNRMRSCDWGVYPYGASHNMSVVGNMVDTHAEIAYVIDGLEDCLVIGNTSVTPADAAAYGIYGPTANSSMVVGNRCEGTGGGAIYSLGTGVVDSFNKGQSYEVTLGAASAAVERTDAGASTWDKVTAELSATNVTFEPFYYSVVWEFGNESVPIGATIDQIEVEYSISVGAVNDLNMSWTSDKGFGAAPVTVNAQGAVAATGLNKTETMTPDVPPAIMERGQFHQVLCIAMNVSGAWSMKIHAVRLTYTL